MQRHSWPARHCQMPQPVTKEALAPQAASGKQPRQDERRQAPWAQVHSGSRHGSSAEASCLVARQQREARPSASHRAEAARLGDRVCCRQGAVAASVAPASGADKGEGKRNAVKACNQECSGRYSFMFSFTFATIPFTRPSAALTVFAIASCVQSPRPTIWTLLPHG